MQSRWTLLPLCRTGTLLAAALAMTACGLSKSPPPPPGYDPLEPVNKAPFPDAAPGDPHPEKINIIKGHNDDTSEDWAHGQGYIHMGIADVWKAMQTSDAMVQHRRLKSSTQTGTNTDPTAEFSFTVHNAAPAPFGISVEWDVACRERATVGTKDDPKTVVVRDDLVMPTDFLQTVSDSYVLTVVDDNTTAFSAIRFQNATQTSPDDAEQYMSDIFLQVAAKAHGQPLPKFN